MMTPRDLRIRKIFQLVSEFFKYDMNKVAIWMETENPLLGNVRPMDMIEFGRDKKLLKFVETQIEEGRMRNGGEKEKD